MVDVVGANFLERMNDGAERVIDEDIIALNHPGGTTIANILYANPRNSKLDLAKCSITNGVWKVAPSSLSIGSSISFTIQNNFMISGVYLSGRITLPAYTNLCSNWLYYLINNLQIQVPGTNNFQYTGITLRDMYLMETSRARRDFLSAELMPAISTGASGDVFDFVCPLPFFWNEGMIATKGFILAANTLGSVINVNIQFNPMYSVVSGVTGHVPLSLPSSFDQLYMKTYAQIEHKITEFEAKRGPAPFKLPLNFAQYFRLPNQTVPSPGDRNSIQLTQLPQGELIRICISASDASKVGNSTNVTANGVDFNPVQFAYLRLTYMGNQLVLLESAKEILNQQLYNSNGDDAALQYSADVFTNNAGATGGQTTNLYNLTTLDCFVPAISGSMYESEFSLANSYNGQIFSLEYQTVDSISTLNWNITYISNGVADIKNGEMELIVS